MRVMGKVRLAVLALACCVAPALAQSQSHKEEDLADTFARMQKETAAAQAHLAARRAEVDRLAASLPRAKEAISNDKRCAIIHYRPGSGAERARRLVNEMAARLIEANRLSIPTFCGVVLWPGDDVDARSLLLLPGDLPEQAGDAMQARAEADAPKAIRIQLGVFEKAQDDAVLAAVLGHELYHLVSGHGVARGMDDDAMKAVAEGFNSSDFDKAVFQHLENRKLGYVQAQETEADRVGRDYIARAGYDPAGMERLLALIEDPDAQKGLSDHPTPENRLALLKREPAPLPPGPAAKPPKNLAKLKELLTGASR